jgi:hypothetical protein
MRLTPALTTWIEKQVTLYSNLLNIKKPKYVLRVKDVLNLPREVTRGRRTSAYKYYGIAYLKHKIIFINVRRSPSYSKLKTTIVHELVHLRFPYMNHGSRFRMKVKLVLNGTQFKPYKKRKKNI